MATYVVVDLPYVVGDDEDYPMQIQVTVDDVTTPVDLTGATIDAQVREDYADVATDVIATAICTPTDPANGKFTMSLSAADTTAMPAFVNGEKKTYRYDVQVTSGGKKKTYGSGKLKGSRQVTTT